MAKSKKDRSLKEILHDLDHKVASVRVAAQQQDQNLANELMQEALTEGCMLLTGMHQGMDDFIEQTFIESDLNKTGVDVELQEIARTPKLEVFRNRESLRSFMNSLTLLLKVKGINSDEIRELKETVMNSYDLMKGQRMSFNEFSEAFAYMEGICCDGPDGGIAAGAPLPRDPKGPGGRSWSVEKLLGLAEALGRMAQFTTLVIHMHGEPQHPAPAVPPREVPIVQPGKMLALLLLAAAAAGLKSLGFEPREVVVEGGVPAGASARPKAETRSKYA